MRTSLIETEQLEHWLLKKGAVEERLLTEAHVQLNPELREKARYQEMTYRTVKHYGRQKLRGEIQAVEQELFRAPKHHTFRERIRSIFSR